MALPKVDVVLGNGSLGGVALTSDGVAGLVLSGAAEGTITLNSPRQIFGIADITTLGITESNNPLAVDEIKAFYAKSGDGAECWITLYSDATLLATVCDKTQSSNIVKTLLDAAAGRIRVLGINKKVPAGYTPVTTQGIDADVITAATNLQALLAEYALKYKPVRALLPALEWTGETSAIINLRANTTNRVGFVIGADKLYSTKGKAAIGMAIGRAASIQVHRNIGRVKDGAMTTTAYFTNGSTADSKESMWTTLHDKGFIFLLSHVGKNGYFFNDDNMSVALTDDYNSLSLGRTIDKAIVIAYSTYVDELLDNIEIDTAGKIAVGVCKYLESKISNAVNASMAGEISSFSAYINPAQNVLSNGKLAVVAKIIPTGTLKEITVLLGFSNPSIS